MSYEGASLMLAHSPELTASPPQVLSQYGIGRAPIGGPTTTGGGR